MVLNVSGNQVFSKKQLLIQLYVDFCNIIIKIWVIYSILKNDIYFSAVKVILFLEIITLEFIY